MRTETYSQDAVLDEAICRAQLSASSRALIEIPGDSTVRRIVRRLLAMTPRAPVEASAGELRLLAKVCCLMALRNPKWSSTTPAICPPTCASDRDDPPQRLVWLLQALPGSDEHRQLMGLRNQFIEILYTCVPRSERKAFDFLLRVANASESLDAWQPSGLPVTLDAGAWFVLEACQKEIYALPSTVRGEKPEPSEGCDIDFVESVIVANRLATIRQAIDALPWRAIRLASSSPSESLFSRLLLQASLNRFLLTERGLDRLSRTSAMLQGDVLRALKDAGYTSIRDAIRSFTPGVRTNFVAMTQEMLSSTPSLGSKRISPHIRRVIRAQINAIIESCGRVEFRGDEISKTLLKDVNETEAVAWLMFTWAALHRVEVFNEDPSIHRKNVRLVSQRSAAETHGQGMMLRRRMLSSVLVSRQMDELSLSRWQRQTHYAQTVRNLCRDTITATFRYASLSQWQEILEYFDLHRKLATFHTTHPWATTTPDSAARPASSP